MSNILVLPGTKWQVPLIKKIKSLGHQVFLVNPTANPGVRDLADHFLASDIFDIDAIEEYAKANHIDAVISDECDIAMPVVAQLGERLNLSALSCEAAKLFTNKYLMRNFSRELGLAAIEYALCDTPEKALDFFHEIGQSVIIKPVDSNASHGVFLAQNDQDILDHFEEARSYSRTVKSVLIERYIHGTEFTVDGVKTPDHHYTLAISEKKHYSHHVNVANELLFTHSNERYDYEELKEINDCFVMNSPLAFGLTHAEYKYEDGVFYLIEIAARGGGNLISSVIAQHMAGCDNYDYLIRCSLGEHPRADFTVPASHRGRAAVLKFFDISKSCGTVKEIRGIDYLMNEPDIMAFHINCAVGDSVGYAENDSDRIGYYIACSETREKLSEVMEIIDKNFRIEVS